jgi:hypothetical protein
LSNNGMINTMNGRKQHVNNKPYRKKNVSP